MTVTGPGQPLYANAPQGSAFALHAMECGNAGGGRCAVSGPVASQLNDPRGTNSVTLLPDEMPVHTHPANVDNVRPSTPEPAGRLPARFPVRNNQALSVGDGFAGTGHDDARPFLARLYASTREAEMRMTGWSAAQQSIFLQSQFAAQQRAYLAYPDARFLLALHDGEPAGRLYLQLLPDRLHVIDISLMPTRAARRSARRIHQPCAGSPRDWNGHCFPEGYRHRCRLKGEVLDWLNIMQWPAMAVTVAATWLVGSRGAGRRRIGFWVFLASNLMWVVWGLHTSAYALVTLQFALAALNIRGMMEARKAKAHPSPSPQP